MHLNSPGNSESVSLEILRNHLDMVSLERFHGEIIKTYFDHTISGSLNGMGP